jgi:hypothetical protein
MSNSDPPQRKSSDPEMQRLLDEVAELRAKSQEINSRMVDLNKKIEAMATAQRERENK